MEYLKNWMVYDGEHKHHKYIKKENGRYYYEDDLYKDRVLGQESLNKYINDYCEKYPEVIKEAEEFSDMYELVKNFSPINGDGTYSLDEIKENGNKAKSEDLTDGYNLTFHQNKTYKDKMGYYTPETYAIMCAITKREIKDKVYIGCFSGSSESSFHTLSDELSVKFGSMHNQHSRCNNQILAKAKATNDWVKNNPFEEYGKANCLKNRTIKVNYKYNQYKEE